MANVIERRELLSVYSSATAALELDYCFFLLLLFIASYNLWWLLFYSYDKVF